MNKEIQDYKVGQKFEDFNLHRFLYLKGSQMQGRAIEFESQPTGDYILEWTKDVNKWLQDGTLKPIEL